ncbi:MAG TPA: VWA domain-containing protein [Casimicrobiaceae bacterium]|nr:VWA domain-containing protein [Casimicrobiaceae bacterium]
MSFLWPHVLWFLLAIPGLVALYVWLLRRKRTGVRYASLSLVRDALGARQRFRRHVPPLLFLLGLTAIIIASARPTAVITLPSEQRTIILVMDVSLSMKATDVEPNRLAAAQTAAKAFVQDQPKDVRIGIVEFAGTASVAQAPTHNREDLIAAIDRFEVQRHTAIGSGIIVALATLFPDQGIEVGSFAGGGGMTRDRPRGSSIDKQEEGPAKPPPEPVAPGSLRSAAIIMLTDGRRTIGPDPLDAARMAADRGVRIYTVGFGTAEGGLAGFEGMSIYMRFDEETLRAIADITRGEFYAAGSAAEVKKVYEKLNASYVLEKKETEITSLATAVAAVLIVLAVALSLAWYSR